MFFGDALQRCSPVAMAFACKTNKRDAHWPLDDGELLREERRRDAENSLRDMPTLGETSGMAEVGRRDRL